MLWCRRHEPAVCCLLGCSVLYERFGISLLVWPWFRLEVCLLFGRFMPAPSSCLSNPTYILGSGRVVLSSEGVLAELTQCGRRCYVLCGHRWLFLVAWLWFWLELCLFFDRFVLDPYYCASVLLSLLGVCLVVLLYDVLITELPWWGWR